MERSLKQKASAQGPPPRRAQETYFGLKEEAKTKKVPGTILTTEDSSSPFSSFGAGSLGGFRSLKLKITSLSVLQWMAGYEAEV